MKTINNYYKSKESFISLVNENKLDNTKSILIQVFTSILDIDKITKIRDEISSVLPNAIIIGATTDGEILNTNVTTSKTIISCSIFDKSSLKSDSVIKNNLTDYDMGVQLAKKLVVDNTKLLILFADGLNTNGEEFLKGVNSISKDIMIAGGLAADGGTFNGTTTFTQNDILQNGSVGIAINSDILNVKNSYHFGWQKIGPIMKVNKSDKNRVYLIDNKTPYEIYKYYLGENAANKLPAIGIEFPLIISKNGIDIARAILGKNEDGSLIFAGNIHQGDSVQLGFGNINEILKTTDKDKILANSKAESIFIYSCMARRRFLQDDISSEIEIFTTKNIPVSGFFTNGEFFKYDKSVELLNQTMTTIILSENKLNLDKNKENSFPNNNLVKNSSQSDTMIALSHLVNITSKELENVNSNLQKSVDKKTIQLQEKIIELEKATRIKSDFLANMSHEIRTPLNAIMGFIDIIKENEHNKKNDEYLNIVKSSSDSLLNIINDILDFSKIESGNMTLENIEFNLKQIVKDIGLLFYEKAKEKDINIKIQFDKNLPSLISGDPVRFKQIAINLISNAIKFTPENGIVKMNVMYKLDSHILTFEVEDSGIGISSQNINKIFNPFLQEDSSTTRKFGGTGLGLSICSNLVKLMDGELKVSSKLNEGSKFYFSIPIIENKSIDKFKEVKKEIKEDFNFISKKVLLVEDNKANQMFMKVILNKMGLVFDIANDGLEAVNMFKINSYDTILMDENMPNMNGIEATRQILNIEKENNLNHTPIIALTANALKGDRERFLNAGMDEYLTKPLNKIKLTKTLNIFIGK